MINSDISYNLFKDMNWSAKWIWKSMDIHVNDFAYFRKEFIIKKPVQHSRVYVSAHNHFELYINGIKLNGYMSPAPSHPQKSKYYLCYDIKELLVIGRNAFCASVHFIGGDGQNYVNGFPGFILQCDVRYQDNSIDTFITDETWKAKRETPFCNGTEFQQIRRISAIEIYDARKEEPTWIHSGFDDAHWDKACNSYINEDGWVLKPQAIPEGKIHEIIVPVPVGIQKKGLQVFDIGKIVSGWPRLDLQGIEGVQIMTRYSESIDDSGTVKHNVCNEKSENYYDIYIMKGSESEIWEPSFSYKAFRYVEISGYPKLINPESIKIISAGTGLSYKGYFNSSNLLLNDIYNACIQTQKNNVLGQMTDCPHREQAQYLADSDLQAETFIYSFSDPEVLRKVLLDFKDGQFESGQFQFVFPSNLNQQFDINIPEWDLHYCTLLWKMYYYFDNLNILIQCYEAAKKMVEYYCAKRNAENGLVPKGTGYPKEWNISDHPHSNIDNSGSALTVQNCLLYEALSLTAKMSSILGHTMDKTIFDEQAKDLKQSILKKLYNPVKKLFYDSYGSTQYHQGTNVVAYQYGLVPEEDREAVLGFIVQEGLNCSTLLSLNLLQVLFENGKELEAFRLLDRIEKPGWGHMIAKGSKTIWEGFNDIESHSHAWNAYPARILVEYLVGISATSPGFKNICIKPYFAPDMKFAEARVPTLQGNIYSRWTINKCILKIKVEIPAGTSATVVLPKNCEIGALVYHPDMLTEKMYIKQGKDGINTLCEVNKKCIVFEVGSGTYLFKFLII